MKPSFRVLAAGALALAVAACSRNPAPESPEGGEAVVPGDTAAGAVASINAQEARSRYTRVEEMIAARAAGVEVTRKPNGDYSIRIRGTTSYNGTNDPLVMIDGVPSSVSALAGINPNDVKRIDVLKDPGSTAMYGVRGSAGVILITTKRGR